MKKVQEEVVVLRKAQEVLWQPPVVTTSRYTQSIKLSTGYQVMGDHKRT